MRLGTEHLTESGAIVLVSDAPARRAKPGRAALASVGGAVEQFARAVAPELAPRRINVVSPGVIDTPMFGTDADARVKMLERHSQEFNPSRGYADEVTEAIVFVAGNEFVTGTGGSGRRLDSQLVANIEDVRGIRRQSGEQPTGGFKGAWSHHYVLRGDVDVAKMPLWVRRLIYRNATCQVIAQSTTSALAITAWVVAKAQVQPSSTSTVSPAKARSQACSTLS